MWRTVTHNAGYVPDYTFRVRKFKRRLGITDRGDIHGVTVHGDLVTVTLIRPHHQRVDYHLDQGEFKSKLGIPGPRPVSIVFASVWSGKVQMSLAKAE